MQICQQLKILVLCCIRSRMVSLLKFTDFPIQVSSFLLLISNSIYLRYKHSPLALRYYISVCCALLSSAFIYISWTVTISVNRAQEWKKRNRPNASVKGLSIFRFLIPVVFYANEGGWVRQNTTVVGPYFIELTMTTCFGRARPSSGHELVTNKKQNYEGKSKSKLQIVIEKRRMGIMTYKQHLFFNVISRQI